MNFMRLAMPGLGGLVLAATDAYWIYFLMTALYASAVLTLAKVPLAPAAAGPSRGSGIADIVDGLRYMVRDSTILMLLMLNMVIVLFSMPYQMMLPGFVKEVLDGGPDRLGLLMSITGLGSLAGSLFIASLPSRGRGKLLLLGSMLLGIALVAFSASTWFWLTLIIMVFIGVGQSARMSLSNVLVQAYVDDAYRGRVMSIYMMEHSLVQFGTFIVGIIASLIGVQAALGGVALALFTSSLLVYMFVPRMRNLD
jgi:MFS family permease